MGSWMGWGWDPGRPKLSEAEVVTMKAKTCTRNAGRRDTPVRIEGCTVQAESPRVMGGGGTGSLGPGPQGPAWACSEVRPKLAPSGCVRARSWDSGSMTQEATSPLTPAQAWPRTSQQPTDRTSYSKLRPNPSQSQRVACRTVLHLHFSNQLCHSRTLCPYYGIFLTSQCHSIKN